MSRQDLIQLSRQGNANAIALLINRDLNPKGITVKVRRTGDRLQILIESQDVPNQDRLIQRIRGGIQKLGIANIKMLNFFGRQLGEDIPIWSQTVDLRVDTSTTSVSTKDLSMPDKQINGSNLEDGTNQPKRTTKDVLVPESDLSPIEAFLRSRGVQIRTIPPEGAADNIINSLSDFLGSNYECLSELLGKIKRNMQQGGSITQSLRNYAQRDVGRVCQFCTNLHEIAFLEEYRYFRSPQYLIRARTTTWPVAQKFFSGQWLERFVFLSVRRSINLVSEELGKTLDLTYLLNPQVVLPNGNNFEFDLIFQVNQSYYWIEAKSSGYQQHINRYSRVSRILNLDLKHSIIVLTDITPDRSEALTALFSMTVCSLSRLEEMLITTLREDHAA